jgi:hypothetical protein
VAVELPSQAVLRVVAGAALAGVGMRLRVIAKVAARAPPPARTVFVLHGLFMVTLL